MSNIVDSLWHKSHPKSDRIAIRDSQRGERTYCWLEIISSKISEELSLAGLRAASGIVLCLEKSPDAVALIVGALELKCHYIPVDPRWPDRRLHQITEFDEWLVIAKDHSFLEFIKDNEEVEIRALRSCEGDLCLVRFLERSIPRGNAEIAIRLMTSGSTGVPKGVLHSHSSVNHLLTWCEKEFRITENDRWVSIAGFFFDLSVLDVFLPLRNGGVVALADTETVGMPPRLSKFVQDTRATVIYTTPTVYSLLLSYGRLVEFDLSGLRLLLSAGEAFSVDLARKLISTFDADVYNLYGPTESNVCTFYQVQLSDLRSSSESIPIGRMIDGMFARVVDDELWIRGSSMMMGYLTAGKVDSGVRFEEGEYWYQTGDRVSFRDSENLVYRGRVDRMIKSRGVRIEPLEIELILQSHPNVEQAAVIQTTNPSLLTAYVVLRSESKDHQLEKQCRESLPSSMVPQRFIYLREMPTTATLKIDFQRLASGLVRATNSLSKSEVPE